MPERYENFWPTPKNFRQPKNFRLLQQLGPSTPSNTPMNIRIRFTSSETRMIVLLDPEDRTIVCSFVWTKHRNEQCERAVKKTKKRGNCECIATWGRPTPRQSSSVLITTLCEVWNRSTHSLQYYSVFAADTLLYAVTLTFDLWPWTFVVYRLWRDETLYQIWTQSSNPRRSYCDISIWPYNLEHILRVALGCGIIFTRFDLRQLIRAWLIAFLCW